jgi:NTP pyrophosphatase (non-canonical NTP hydrolase)
MVMSNKEMTIRNLIKDSKENANRHGWSVIWKYQEGEPHRAEVMDVPTALALCHSELSEALEEWRDNKRFITQDLKISQKGEELVPKGFPIEIADLLIRVFHLCGDLGIDIEAALRMKMEKNESRPYHHGRANV